MAIDVRTLEYRASFVGPSAPVYQTYVWWTPRTIVYLLPDYPVIPTLECPRAKLLGRVNYQEHRIYLYLGEIWNHSKRCNPRGLGEEDNLVRHILMTAVHEQLHRCIGDVGLGYELHRHLQRTSPIFNKIEESIVYLVSGEGDYCGWEAE